MKYLLTKELLGCEEKYSDIYLFLKLAARKNFQIVIIEDDEKLKNFQKHFSSTVLNIVLEKIKKDVKLFTTRKSNLFKINLVKDNTSITIEEAINIISQPFLICMENNRNDKNFLNFFSDNEQQYLLKDLEASCELVYWSGGGTGELKKKIENEDFCSTTSYVFFDSDRLPFDSTSIQKASKEIENICISKNIKYSLLQRRFIESYVPMKSLSGYVYQNKKNKKKYNKLFQEFSKLHCNDTRHFYNMKVGLKGDIGRVGGKQKLIKTYFYNIPSAKIQIFENGFGDKLSAVYEEKMPISEKMKDIEGWTEINGIVKNILMVI
ncbi:MULTISPECIES: hypothetical protein [Acinetobacter]|nr:MULTISPECIES: hypothetical protein [Acinetobacter]ENV03353.1 hypothetical protein F968_01704 [Acinetobacter sp. NIPH 817]MCU4636661.1 hypothetical protein [Acinetobacter sp. WU_MDCI_Abxa265]RFF23433.1 hypothetical protein DZ985_13425 [Acinetobacter sp. JW]